MEVIQCCYIGIERDDKAQQPQTKSAGKGDKSWKTDGSRLLKLGSVGMDH